MGRPIFFSVLIILLLIGLIGLILVSLIAGRVTRPAEALALAAQRISDGQLDRPVVVGGEDEIGRAGLAFERMREKLRAMLNVYFQKGGQELQINVVDQAVLRDAIRRNGTSFDWVYPDGRMQEHLKVYGRAGEPCCACRTPIEVLRVAQRGTHYCPRCQRA